MTFLSNVIIDIFAINFTLTLMYDSENFEPIEAPKTMLEIEEEKMNQERVEIVLKNQDEVMRRRLIRYGGAEMIFGFIIKMVTDDKINQQRNFMLKYYLDDTEFAIYEFRETNSGKFNLLEVYCVDKLSFVRLLNCNIVDYDITFNAC